MERSLTPEAAWSAVYKELSEVSDESSRTSFALRHWRTGQATLGLVRGRDTWVLGPRIRFAILMDQLGQTPQEIADQCPAAVGMSPSKVYRLRQMNSKAAEWVEPNVNVALLTDDLMRRLDIKEGREPTGRGYASFMAFEAEGPHAVAAFRGWLRGQPPLRPARIGDSYLKEVARDHAYSWLEEEKRDELVRTILTHVAAEDGRPILSVYGDGLPAGLTALAQHVWSCKPRTDGRCWLYLPVSRGLAGVNDCRFTALVGRLYAFFTGMDPASEVAASLFATTNEQEERQISLIRERMATEPAVILIDGFSTTPRSDDLPTVLLDRIRDEPVVALLERLVEPLDPILGSAELDAAGAVNRTRIVVLGNQSVYNPQAPGGLTLHCAEPHELHGVSRANAGNLLDLMEKDGRFPFVKGERKAIEATLSGCSPPFTDSKINLLRAVFALGKTPPNRNILDTGRLAATVLAGLRAKNDTGYWALAFFSLSETGLRSSTFRRLVKRWEGGGLPLGTGEAGKIDNPDAATAVYDLLRSMGRLVRFAGDETVPHLHVGGRVAEYDIRIWGKPHRGLDTSRAYEIVDPVVRAAINAELEMVEPELFLDMHLLLAEEALQQYTIIARHSEPISAFDLRSRRRLLQAIYHGLLSVPVMPRPAERLATVNKDTDEIEGAASEALVAQGGPCALMSRPAGSKRQVAVLLPPDPDERLRQLVEFYYLGLLERPPEWALTRQFGDDSLKIDILRLASERLEQRPGVASLRRARASVREALTRTSLRNNDKTTFSRMLDMAKMPTVGMGRRVTYAAPYGRLVAERDVLENEHHLAWHGCVGSVLGPEYMGIDVTPPENIRVEADHIPLADITAAAQAWARDAASKALEAVPPMGAAARTELGNVAERLCYVDSFHAQHTARTIDEVTAKSLMRTACFHFLAAVFYRREIANAGFTSRDKISAAAGRGFVSSALGLGRLSPNDAERAAFFIKAGRVKDRLTLQKCHLAAERADILIMQAQFCRIADGNPDAAIALLRAAERFLPPERGRPGVRMRFLVERAETYLAKAVSPDKPEKKLTACKRLAARTAARVAAEQLSALSESYGLKPYRAAAKELFRLVREADEKAEACLPKKHSAEAA